jgi:RimJ/RimL family protein N-acetyltransferase
MEFTTKTVQLADGRTLVVRRPETETDLDKLVAFFAKLPPQVKNYLRYNVDNKDFFRQRLDSVDGRDHWRLVAELDGEIVGDATMDREPFGWTRHMAELRAVVDPQSENLGVESVLFNQLAHLGSASKVERLFVEVLEDHRGLVKILEKEGFVKEGILKDRAKDQRGKLHDVVILSNDLETVWKSLEERLSDLDLKLHNAYRMV